MNDLEQHIDYCVSCGCKMDISAMEPFTNVICPECGVRKRVKCELGQYLLTSRYAAGGMSMVFLAKDTVLEREVAIKILNEKYSGDEKRMAEFEREAKVTAALTHPHIVRMFTVGKSYGCYFIAMEMVPGGDLESKMSKEGAIKESEILPMAHEVILGLKAAKEAGVIHRDVKPGNILFDSNGHVKIVDFGLALVTQGGKAKAEEIWATPYYVPPEALDGAEEDFRSDIYALGATLYHALSGEPPLPADAKSTRAVRKAKENIPPLEEVAPWLNEATCYLVNKAMALDPKDRFSSYRELEAAWDVAYQQMQTNGSREPIRSKGRKKRRAVKNKTKLNKKVISGLFLVITLLFIWFVFVKNKPNEVNDDKQRPEFKSPNPENLKNQTSHSKSLYSPKMEARIIKYSNDSHQYLKQGNYREGAQEFDTIIHDPDVKEPLKSWAQVEICIASWLGGNDEDALFYLNRLKKSIQENTNDKPAEVVQLEVTLRSLKISNSGKIENGPTSVICLMAMALKNWQTGFMTEAVPFFEKVVAHPLPKGHTLEVYKAIAQKYLSDYELLKPLMEKFDPQNEQEAKKRLFYLDSVVSKLKTRGRAKFNVRIWQLRLHHQMKALKKRKFIKD